MQPWRSEHTAAMTYDEVSMEQSKSFVKALQELKNLRPQLYSAAEYCEKSYLHNDQKQIVLDNLKDYAVRALVNAVDHLGTVAYKLTDLYEQNTLDISTVELQVSCLNQRISTCQEYGGKEGLRQQQIYATVPKHHKHYILPNTVNQKAMRNQLSQSQAKPHPHPQVGTTTSKTLSWHLDSESNSGTRSLNATMSIGESKPFKLTSEVFHLLDAAPEEATTPLPLAAHLQSSNNGSSNLQSFGVKESLGDPKPLSTFKSFDNPRRDIIRAPVRNKSMLSVFFAKSKASNSKKHAMGLK